MEPWTALTIGFLGSFHCIGMCGPLALALPGGRGSVFSVLAGRVYYNLGRVTTYSLLGVLFGLIGHSLALAGFQKALSIVLGLIIIGMVTISSRYAAVIKDKLGVNDWFNRLKKLIGMQYRRQGMSTLFVIGLLNGLLPCGFVYMGLAGSITTGTVWESALYMTLFGLGTFPAMFAVSLAPHLISLDMRRHINKITPYLSILLGLYLIYRGMAMSVGH